MYDVPRKTYEYIYFQIEPPQNKKKTRIWKCHNKSSGDVLGVAKWYGPWRQYCFYPNDGTIFNGGCLDNIKSFVTMATTMHKRKKEE